MESYLSRILIYLLNVLESTFNQLFILFGPLLVLTLLLNFSAGFTARLSVRLWGRNLFLYGFAWLGCSVHEISHVFFALVFGHKITEIELFKPNSDGESLGHVAHSYNKKSIYQKIGNFFIGIGPLLAGGMILFLVTVLFFHFDITSLSTARINSNVLTRFLSFKHLASGMWTGLLYFLSQVFAGDSAVWWRSALFIYILYSVGSSMTLSKSDVKSAISGFLWLILILLIFNLISLWAGDFATSYLARVADFISGFYFLLILSLFANLLFIVILFILYLIKSLFVSR
jgi:hypothetical protein